MPLSQILVVSLLLLCFGSFSWGMRRFFVQPSGYTAGMKVTTAGGILFAVLHLAGLAFPSETHRYPAAATGFYLLSLLLFWWAIRTNQLKPLSAVFSSDLPAHLVNSGPYRWMRHPFYASYMLAWIAGPIACGHLGLWLTVAVMLALYVRAAHQEERKFSASPLAGAYDLYRTRTGLLVPNPLKLVLAKGLIER